MDIVGFSIVIPLFPHLLDYYITTEGSAGTLIGALNAAAEWMGITALMRPPQHGLVMPPGGTLRPIGRLVI